MSNITICDHANKRIKQRVGIKGFAAQLNYVEKAYKCGLRKEECNCPASVRLLQAREGVAQNRELVLYRDQVFVFEDSTLVTVLPIDHDYQKVMNAIRCKNNRRSA